MRDLWRFAMENKIWWLAPIVLVGIGLAVLVWLGAGESLSSSIYNIF